MAQLFNPALPKNYNPFAWLEQMQKRYLAQTAQNVPRAPTMPATRAPQLFRPLEARGLPTANLFNPALPTASQTKRPTKQATERTALETMNTTTEPKPPPILGTDTRVWDLTARRIDNTARQVPDEWRKTWDDLSNDLKEQMAVWKQDSVNAFLKAYAERDWDAVNRIANDEAYRQAQQAKELQKKQYERDRAAFVPQIRKSAYVAG